MDDCPKCDKGLPPWLATFADLMSLLMCFFVLLLSFAEVDAIRFKRMAESMRDAFGVQREMPVNEVVKGTSVIMQEFSTSSSPELSPIEEIRQQTIEEEKENLKVEEGKEEEEEKGQAEKELEVDAAMEDAVAEKIRQEMEQQAEELRQILQKEIAEGLLSIETEDTKIIVRIQEKGLFVIIDAGGNFVLFIMRISQVEVQGRRVFPLLQDVLIKTYGILIISLVIGIRSLFKKGFGLPY